MLMRKGRRGKIKGIGMLVEMWINKLKKRKIWKLMIKV